MQFSTREFVNATELGSRIRHARERIGISQEELAHRVNRDQKAVSEYENGRRKLPATELLTFARALEIPVAYFFEGEAQEDELDQLLLQEFRTLPTLDDKRTAIQAIRLISETVKRYTSFLNTSE